MKRQSCKSCIPWLLALLLFTQLGTVQAQSDDDGEKGVFQLSGMVLDASTSDPVPYAAIRINHSRRGGVANIEGFFSIPVLRTDTLFFKCVGYKINKIVVGDYLKSYTGDTSERFLYLVQYLTQDNITTPTVNIYSYNSPDEIRMALLNMPMRGDDAASLARGNVNPEVLGYMMSEMPTSGEDRLNVAQQRFYQLYQNQRAVGSMGFDAVAAYRLARHLAQKAKQKREKVYDYWPEER